MMGANELSILAVAILVEGRGADVIALTFAVVIAIGLSLNHGGGRTADGLGVGEEGSVSCGDGVGECLKLHDIELG